MPEMLDSHQIICAECLKRQERYRKRIRRFRIVLILVTVIAGVIALNAAFSLPKWRAYKKAGVAYLGDCSSRVMDPIGYWTAKEPDNVLVMPSGNPLFDTVLLVMPSRYPAVVLVGVKDNRAVAYYMASTSMEAIWVNDAREKYPRSWARDLDARERIMDSIAKHLSKKDVETVFALGREFLKNGTAFGRWFGHSDATRDHRTMVMEDITLLLLAKDRQAIKPK